MSRELILQELDKVEVQADAALKHIQNLNTPARHIDATIWITNAIDAVRALVNKTLPASSASASASASSASSASASEASTDNQQPAGDNHG